MIKLSVNKVEQLARRASRRRCVPRVAARVAAVRAERGGAADAAAARRSRARERRARSAFAPDEPPTAFIAQRGSLSLAQATAIAQSRFQGRVVRAETVQQGGRVIHVIRILGDDGRVRTVRVDAETGAVM